MSLAENVATLPQPRGGSYELTRLNALRHGVLSQHTVLPWENRDEYLTLVEALVAEHRPHGPTEEHLVEELAGIIWRKRRLRLGEAAVHHRGLKRSTDPFRETAKAALIHLSGDVTDQSVTEAITASEEQTAEDRSDLESDQVRTKKALCLVDKPSASAYSRALAELPEDTREWWEEQLSWEPDDYEKGQTPYRADSVSLKRSLKMRSCPGTTSAAKR
jgi:hypothetical protein